MEADTGASLSLISEKKLSVWTDKNSLLLQPTSTCLQTYTGERIPVLGSLQEEVSHRSQTKLRLLVVKGQGPALLGRDWMKVLTLNSHTMQNNKELDKLLDLWICYSN